MACVRIMVDAYDTHQHNELQAMNNDPPAWAFRAATSDDLGLVQEAHRQGRMHITWPPANELRTWAKHQGWSTPLFGFENAFITKILETKTYFALAIENSGIEIRIPRQKYTISSEVIQSLDELYAGRASTGRPDGWGILVEELRGIRRAVETGVVVHIEGEPPLLNWQDFYQWAHGRYHMLEDGYDKWIGDDS